MGDPLSIAFGIGSLALAGASTGYQINAAEEAKSRASAQAKEAKQKTESALAEVENRKKEEEFKASQVELRDVAKKKQRALAAGSQGRAGTILTSAVGIPNQNQAPGKTLLGA